MRERSVTRIGVKPSLGGEAIDVQQCSTPVCPECVWPVASPSASGWWQKSPSSKVAPASAIRAIVYRRRSLISIQFQEFSMKVLPNNHEISMPSLPCLKSLVNHNPFVSSWQAFSLSQVLLSNPRSAEAHQRLLFIYSARATARVVCSRTPTSSSRNAAQTSRGGWPIYGACIGCSRPCSKNAVRRRAAVATNLSIRLLAPPHDSRKTPSTAFSQKNPRHDLDLEPKCNV